MDGWSEQDGSSRQEALEQFTKAQRLAHKYFSAAISRGEYPYPQVLGEIFDERMAAGRQNIGVVDIPMDRIVGTTTSGRKSAFAGNFMPLLEERTEFGAKWIALCEAHLSSKGITEPIVCVEYMGRFYVTEGNKRVSVLKSYDAVTIPGHVTRIIPNYSDDIHVRIYYEFMRFYQVSRIYDVTFRRLGGYARLQALLGFDPQHHWTMEERRHFRADFRVFSQVFEKMNTERLELDAGDALLVYLEVYSREALAASQAEITKNLHAIWPDIRLLAADSPIEVQAEPQREEKPSLLRSLGIGRISHLNVAFIHAFDPKVSAWTAAQEEGRLHLERVRGDKVTTRSYLCRNDTAVTVMDLAVQEGAQVIFATTPSLMDACRQIAARYPQVRVLNCSLSMPYAGVRTYYSRMYESKFITGALAGAMSRNDRIGYIANYPIIGTPACINAFALGARLTNPRARIVLRWSCLPGDHVQAFRDEGITVISNLDGGRRPTDNAPEGDVEWGTFSVERHDNLMPLATPVWNWGRLYEHIVDSIFSGNWDLSDARENDKAVNYWWGMKSGVIDVKLCDDLPNGMVRLAEILKNGMERGALTPFDGRLVDQNGCLRGDGTQCLSLEEIMRMDWLVDSVEGNFPAYDEVMPASRELVRLLGIRRTDEEGAAQ